MKQPRVLPSEQGYPILEPQRGGLICWVNIDKTRNLVVETRQGDLIALVQHVFVIGEHIRPMSKFGDVLVMPAEKLQELIDRLIDDDVYEAIEKHREVAHELA